MPRIAHGEVVTPGQVLDAQRELASSPGSGRNLDAAGPEDLQAYGFLFKDLQRNGANLLPQSPDTPGHLKKLGETMEDRGVGGAGHHGDAGIPSIYTYFAQFVDHDITLEQSSFTLQELVAANMVPLPAGKIRQLKNLRHPTLDLDSVYGPTSPPGPEPLLDPAPPGRNTMHVGSITRLTDPPPVVEVRSKPFLRVRLKGDDNDLPRLPRSDNKRDDRAAMIGDPRNDENLIVAQLHVAFLKAHNELMKQGKTFGQARRLLRQHYQHVVIHDFLKRVADRAIVNRILRHGNQVYDALAEPFFMPLEFTVAAYRFGHSMVRESYDFNLNFNSAELFLLFAFTAFSGQLGTDVFPQTATLPDN